MKVEKEFSRLIEIMAKLRGEGGCPWDKEQNHRSLRQHLIEETYEVIEAIDEKKYDHLAGELGDLLLQIVFHAQLGQEAGLFSIDDVVESINQKLIRRHPHVFGDEIIRNSQEQIVAWEKTKLNKEGKKSAVDGVPKELPALLRAYRLQGKAAAVGFDWPKLAPVWEKLAEEIQELKEALDKGAEEDIEEELGDLLFTVVNISRFIKINPEDALRKTIEKFERRFKQVEAEFNAAGQSLSDVSLQEMDLVWDKIKEMEK